MYDHAMEPLRVGLIGLGWWGGVLAQKTGGAGVDIVSCFARTVATRDDFAKAYTCSSASSVDEMLLDPDVEAVLVASPHSTHSDLVIRAAQAGKHVFCDKPFTLDVASGKRAVAATDAAGVVLQVGHNRRRQPGTRRLKHLIDSGGLGTIVYAEANMSLPKELTPRGGWRGNPAESPAGGMTGLGVHMADNLMYLLGRPSRVFAFSRQVLGRSDLDDVTTANLEFKSGPLAVLSTSLVIPDICRTAVWGIKAAAANEMDGAQFLFQATGEKGWITQPIDEIDTVADELAEFAQNVRNRTRPETGGPEALEVIAVLEGIVESAATGQVVNLDEIRARE
jgi:predicted dehydrogenase